MKDSNSKWKIATVVLAGILCVLLLCSYTTYSSYSSDYYELEKQLTNIANELSSIDSTLSNYLSGIESNLDYLSDIYYEM